MFHFSPFQKPGEKPHRAGSEILVFSAYLNTVTTASAAWARSLSETARRVSAACGTPLSSAVT